MFLFVFMLGIGVILLHPKRWGNLLALFLVSFVMTGCAAEQSVAQPNEQQQVDQTEEEQTQAATQQAKPKKTETAGTTERIPVQLVKPIDGDTIAVNYDGNEEKVRFLLVDTPETNHPRLGKQPYGEEAKQFTTDLVANAKTLELEFDVGPRTDKYGRLLAYVYADGKMVQKELLKKGLARVAYIYPPNTRYVDDFDALQKQAQKAGIGIWEIENYAQEDGFHAELIDEESPKETVDSEDCNIKGNINSSKEKIYHTPDSPWYERTKPEVMFCSEKEAVEAGFRPPK